MIGERGGYPADPVRLEERRGDEGERGTSLLSPLGSLDVCVCERDLEFSLYQKSKVWIACVHTVLRKVLNGLNVCFFCCVCLCVTLR